MNLNDMLQRIIYLSLCLAFMASCGTTKTATTAPAEPQAPPPEGIEFQAIENHKEFKKIMLPISGKGFAIKNEDEQFPPKIKYTNKTFYIWPSLGDSEGSLEEQFEIAKRKLGLVVKPETVVEFEELSIAPHQVAKISLYRELGHGYKTLAYGYLVKNGGKASILMVKDGYFMPETDMGAYKSTLDEAMKYMILTMEFQTGE